MSKGEKRDMEMGRKHNHTCELQVGLLGNIERIEQYTVIHPFGRISSSKEHYT